MKYFLKQKKICVNLRKSADKLFFMHGFDFLIHARKFGMKLGLETMQRLADAIGNPESRLKFIHLAGTNGKGSTAALCSSALQEAGHRTALFTSPHLLSITERIQINGTPILESKLESLLNEISEITRTWENPPTFFEILTACALRYFEEQKVDWVVWETGMGGRLDSTNIVTPVVSVITQIDYDHQEFLGETLFKIAIEKAGIIKSQVPVVCGVQNSEALSAIREVAESHSAPWFDPGELTVTPHGIKNRRQQIAIEGIPFQLPLLGEHQIQNALTAFTVLFGVLKIPIQAIQKGFSKAHWPGRFQILRENPIFVIDGAHNPSSMKCLVQTWKSVFGERKVDLIFGVMEEKAHEEMILSLKEIVQRVILVKPNNPRAADPLKIAKLFESFSIPVQIEESLSASWPQLFASTQPTLLTGSLFLVGEAIQLHSPQSVSPTVQLNELLKPAK
jgi:dihydrofolate synthase/folylpolyglutamate synthase